MIGNLLFDVGICGVLGLAGSLAIATMHEVRRRQQASNADTARLLGQLMQPPRELSAPAMSPVERMEHEMFPALGGLSVLMMVQRARQAVKAEPVPCQCLDCVPPEGMHYHRGLCPIGGIVWVKGDEVARSRRVPSVSHPNVTMADQIRADHGLDRPPVTFPPDPG